MSHPNVKQFLDRPEEDDPYGWNGPGWYFYDVTGTSIEGPFTSEDKATECIEDYLRQYEEWLATQATAEGDYFPESEEE